MVVRDQQGQLSLTCPACRQATPIPANGVAGLQSAFHINYLLQIMDEHKKAEDEAASFEETGIRKVSQSGSLCSLHDKRELELYCETCSELICFKCIMKGSRHHDHDYYELNKAFEVYKKEMLVALQPVENQLGAVNEALAQLLIRNEEILLQQTAIEADIHQYIRRLHEILDVRETELIGQLHRHTQCKVKSIASQQDHMETIQAQLSSCLHFAKEIFRVGNQGDFLRMKTSIMKQIEELTAAIESETLKPKTEADLIFVAESDVTGACQNYGQVSALGLPDPSTCSITGKGIEVASVGQESSVVFQSTNLKGKPCEASLESLECVLVSDLTSTKTSCIVNRKGSSSYDISYMPSIKGSHQLHVKLSGQNVRGSPVAVSVRSPVNLREVGPPILTIGALMGPRRIALTQKGEVVITESEGSCISVFSPNGKIIRSIDVVDSFLSGVAVDGEGNVLVTDCSNDRILKLTTEGQLLMSSEQVNEFDSPYAVAFNATNNMLYVTCDSNCVYILNSDLTISSQFGGGGNKFGQFRGPRGITCDNTGAVFVADSGNSRIQVFTPEGVFLRWFGKRGVGMEPLKWPPSVAVDADGTVYVSEHHGHRISVFNSEGKFLSSFGNADNRPTEFNCPIGLAIDRSGVLYVCDNRNNCVKLF